MHHIRQAHLPDGVVLLCVLAAGVVEGLLRTAVDVLQLRQHLPGKGGAVVLTQQLQRGDGRLDLVDPLLDVGPIFAPLPLHLADPLQHGLPGQLQELIVHLLLRLVRHRHDLGEQIPLLQLRGHFQQFLQPFLSGDIAGGKVQGQDKHPGGKDEQDRLNVVPHRQQEQGQSQRAQQVQQDDRQMVFEKQFPAHMVYPCRCLVLIKSVRPRPASFSRMRVMLTLRALSST